MIFHHLQPYFLIAQVLEHEKMEKIVKLIGRFYISVKNSFFNNLSPNQNASLELSLHPNATSEFPAAVCSGWRTLKEGSVELPGEIVLFQILIFFPNMCTNIYFHFPDRYYMHPVQLLQFHSMGVKGWNELISSYQTPPFHTLKIAYELSFYKTKFIHQ